MPSSSTLHPARLAAAAVALLTCLATPALGKPGAMPGSPGEYSSGPGGVGGGPGGYSGGLGGHSGEPGTARGGPGGYSVWPGAARGGDGGTARPVLELTPGAVGRIPAGGSAEAAERMLRRTLGPPDRAIDSKGCELDASAEPRRTLTWGALAVSLAPAGTGRLVGWTVGDGRIPPRVTLPHDVTTATTVREAMRRIPGAATRWDEVFQMYWITAPAEPTMMWAGDHEDGTGRIAYITNAFEPCE